MWNNIIEQLEILINSIDDIQEVFIYEAEKFSGSPTVSITPAENDGAYATNSENERIYAFNVRLFVNRTVAPAGQVKEIYADSRMRDILDQILNTIDKNYSLPDITNEPGNCFINLLATPSVWGYSGRESEYRSAEINVKARVRVDINLLT